MSKIEQLLEIDSNEMDVMRFESWYWSTIDDVSNLIVSNGYANVMKDVQETVDRIIEKRFGTMDTTEGEH